MRLLFAVSLIVMIGLPAQMLIVDVGRWWAWLWMAIGVIVCGSVANMAQKAQKAPQERPDS